MADNGGKAAIRATGIGKTYRAPARDLVVLDGIDLEVEVGASVAVMGPSGSGKSTLLHILGTLDRPTEGSVEIDGVDVGSLRDAALAQLRNRRLGFVFQDHYLLPQLTALENVLVPALAGKNAASGADRAIRLLDRLGLAERRDHLPSELSGGECQRVAIARALVMRPAVLLCDEPTGSVDEATESAIGEAFRSLQNDEGVALVVVTHNRAFAGRFDRVLTLAHGRLDESEGS